MHCVVAHIPRQWFVLENPSKARAFGSAACGLGGVAFDVASKNAFFSSACEIEIDLYGRRMGGHKSMALYHRLPFPAIVSKMLALEHDQEYVRVHCTLGHTR